jgi:hypothetical protein
MRPGVYFFAWCDEAARVDALGATLSALVHKPPYEVDVRLWPAPAAREAPVDEAVAAIRAHFPHDDAEVFLVPNSKTSAGWSLKWVVRCYTDKSDRSKSWGPLHLHPCFDVERATIEVIRGAERGPSSVGPEAVLIWRDTIGAIEDFLLHLCAPDASGRVSTGGCTTAWSWVAPVSMCATYHADARDIARDLALSWVDLHDGESVSRLAGLPMAALRARVEAAPAGARVFPRDNSERAIPLARETVLKALALPGSALLSALIAAADVPDEAWRAAEPAADEIHHLTVQARARGKELPESLKGPALCYVETMGEHIYFLADHAPFSIRRLPSGGVTMATHFYCRRPAVAWARSPQPARWR